MVLEHFALGKKFYLQSSSHENWQKSVLMPEERGECLLYVQQALLIHYSGIM